MSNNFIYGTSPELKEFQRFTRKLDNKMDVKGNRARAKIAKERKLNSWQGKIQNFQRVVCGINNCDIFDEQSGSRADFSEFIRGAGWEYIKGCGWVCPNHKG